MESYLETVPNTSKLKQYKCILCDASYDTLKDLQSHTYVHVPEDENDGGTIVENGIEYEEKELEYEESISENGERVIKIAKIPVPLSAVMSIMRHECVLCEAAFDDLAALQSHSYEHLPLEHEPSFKKEDLCLPDETANLLYKCVLCTASFSTLEGLQSHSYDHLPQSVKRPQCDECGATFACTTNLSRHKHLHKDKIHKCHVCGAAFALRFKLKKHMTTHGKYRSFICDMCGEAFASKSILRLHVSRRHLERRYKCQQCNITFPRLYELQQHDQTQHMIKIYRCKGCSFSFLTKEELTAHKPIHEQSESQDTVNFVCDKCNCVFSNESDFSQHKLLNLTNKQCVHTHKPCLTSNKPSESANKLMLNHQKSHVIEFEPHMHNSSSQSFTCEVCGQVFNRKSTLETHMGSCHLEKQFKCVQCDAKFAWNDELQKHKKKWHMIKIYRCKMCNFSFLTKDELKKHKLIHKPLNEALDYKCDKCGCTFPCEMDLMLHKLVHNSVATGKVTDESTAEDHSSANNCSKLNKNQSFVTDDNPFMCNDCGVLFGSSDTLGQHKEKCHKGRKPHQCKECGRVFKQRSYLTIHARVHARQKPFKCKACGSGFIHSGALRRHMRTHARDGEAEILMRRRH